VDRPWQSTTRETCAQCGQLSASQYVCPPHQIGKCYECLIGCEGFRRWVYMLKRMKMRKPAVMTLISEKVHGRVHGEDGAI
jgi:hypothetical protein